MAFHMNLFCFLALWAVLGAVIVGTALPNDQHVLGGATGKTDDATKVEDKIVKKYACT